MTSLRPDVMCWLGRMFDVPQIIIKFKFLTLLSFLTQNGYGARSFTFTCQIWFVYTLIV